MTLFDPVEGERGKREGMANAEQGAGQDWRDDALAAIELIASKMLEFTTDDVREFTNLSDPPSGNWRALGPAMKRAQGQGVIRPTGRFVLTRQTLRHRAPVAVWQSVRYGA